jgi:hypothetical protein
MPLKLNMNTEVLAQLHLSSNDCNRLRDFLAIEIGVKRKYILRDMHITVYYARRPLPRLSPSVESTEIVVPAVETRFMVMAPGRENPRSDIEPSKNMVGIRIHRQSSAIAQILALRQRLLVYETRRVLGSRPPSTNKVSAFGARWFQPHMVVLRPGSGVQHELNRIGQPFRERLGNLVYDKFEIKIVHREDMRGSYKNIDNHSTESGAA